MYEQQKTTSVAAARELNEFVDTIFEADDLVELRLVETWRDGGRKHSRLTGREWLKAGDISEHHARLCSLNEEGANIFFGVNPRKNMQGTKNAVADCRVLWCDWDGVDAKEALCRCKRFEVPRPSVLVSSGHGIHGYWLLDKAVSVDNAEYRTMFERRLQQLCQLLGGDATQDVSRMMRLPGFNNVKGFRNRDAPIPCKLIFNSRDDRFVPIVCDRWGIQKAPAQGPVVSMPNGTIASTQTAARIRGLVQHLDKDVADRSRRDYGVVVGLLRLGVAPDELRGLVQGKSKFAIDQGGEGYLDRTLARALDDIIADK
jgi:hypothetical protein